MKMTFIISSKFIALERDCIMTTLLRSNRALPWKPMHDSPWIHANTCSPKQAKSRTNTNSSADTSLMISRTFRISTEDISTKRLDSTNRSSAYIIWNKKPCQKSWLKRALSSWMKREWLHATLAAWYQRVSYDTLLTVDMNARGKQLRISRLFLEDIPT